MPEWLHWPFSTALPCSLPRPAGDNFPHCLSDIFFPTGTCKHVYTFLLVWVVFCLTVRAENTSQFATAPECDVEASLFSRTFKGVGDGRSTVGQADEGFFLYLGDLIAGEGLGREVFCLLG